VFNNIFVKNLPANVTDDDIKQLFGVYGNILSLHRGTSEKDPSQAFYFVCFTAEDKNDIEYGPRCAAKAVEELNGKLHEGQNLYVTAALKKSDRQKELAHETLKYKSSKKRCNLYVKGFNIESAEIERDLR
jgi:polyadenylate-binding protein